jgi:hypothetical protein
MKTLSLAGFALFLTLPLAGLWADAAPAPVPASITAKVAAKPALVKKTKPAKRAKAAKAVVKTYTCPMHPEVISHQPGRCPNCGMDLVEKK